MITWSYIAGFIDCDGWITCSKQKNCRTKKCVIGLTQSIKRENGMKQIYSFLNNNGIRVIWIIRKKNWKSDIKMINIMVTHQKSLVIILNKVIPYLLFKREKAEDCLKYVLDRIKKHGYVDIKESPNNRKKWNNNEIKTLIQMVNEGYSNPNIAITLGRTKNSIGKKLNHLGLIRKRDKI